MLCCGRFILYLEKESVIDIVLPPNNKK
ncbi:hypothetical protein IFVP136_C1220367 [Vibrio parahaemolyticus]